MVVSPTFLSQAGRFWNCFVDEFLHRFEGDELKILIYLIRRTVGFQKLEDSVSLSQLLEGSTTSEGRVLNHGTGLGKKRLLKALHSLEEGGHLRVTRGKTTRGGNKTNIYQVGLAETIFASWTTEPTDSAPGVGASCEPRVGAPCGTKQGVRTQGVRTQTHHSSVSPKTRIDCPPASPDDDFSEKRFKKAPKPPALSLTSEQLDLVERMRKLGISLSQAHRVTQQAPPERIRQALEYLPYRNAKNPAGYFVREVLSEGFAAPKPLQAEAERSALKLRKKQEQVEEAEKSRAEEEAYRAQRQAAFEELQPDQLRELVAEARRRAVWAKSDMLGDDSPVLQGLVLDLVDEGWLEKRVFKLNLPPPRGWAECRRGRQEAQEVRV